MTQGKLFRITYAFFVAVITPLSVPFAVYTYLAGWVQPIHWWLFISFSLLTELGITVGYHRYLTHRSFKTSVWVERILLCLGAMAYQGPPSTWASAHLQHHRYADTPKDPHSPHHGFWHAHCLWLFHAYRPYWHPGSRHVFENPSAKQISRFYFPITLLSLLIPFVIAGWMGLLWGGLLRIFVVCHSVFLGNSLTHLWGTRPNAQSNSSGNHWFPALICLGDGWHNNHHAQPRSAFHGWHWYQVDPSAYLIRGLEKLGLIWSVTRPRRICS